MSDNVANMSFTDLVAKLNEIEKRDTAERRKNHKIQVEAAKVKKSKSIKEGLQQALKEAAEIQENVLGMTREEAMPIITPTVEEVTDEAVEEDDTADHEKVTSRQMSKRLQDIRYMVADMEDKISQVAERDNGDLTDQITTMSKHTEQLYLVLSRAISIVPTYEDADLEEDDMNEAIPYMYKLQKDGKSVEEIAKELNMTVDAVKAAMSKQHADEGYSKHPKGSKKYKQHMAAMHAAKG